MVVAVSQLAAYLGIEARDSDQTVELLTLLAASVAIIEADAPGAPVAVKDLAILRHAAYQHDQPYAAQVGQSFANALVNSGAGSLLSRWVVRRLAGAGVVAASLIEAPIAPVVAIPGFGGWVATGDRGGRGGLRGWYRLYQWYVDSTYVGGPGHIFFAVMVTQGYPGDVTAYLETWTRRRFQSASGPLCHTWGTFTSSA